MIHVDINKTQKRSPLAYLFSIAAILALLYLLLLGTREISSRTAAEQMNILNQAVRRAAVQCYAIEGRYPPSIEYMEEHYGLTIDHDKYSVFYDVWASNIMPDITIIPISEEEEAILWP